MTDAETKTKSKTKSTDFDPSLYVACPWDGCYAQAGEFCCFKGKPALGTHYTRRLVYMDFKRKLGQRAAAHRQAIAATRHPNRCHACGREK